MPAPLLLRTFRARLRTFLFLGICIAFSLPATAQRELSGAALAKVTLQRLNTTASVLMIGAHPDDENTAVLAYFARGRKVRTGYLSLTRGEGGQNLIGSEQGDALGIIRTQELLAARRIDGAEQFFTRAIDFGFTKTPQETFEKWGREKILSDVVWIVRRFQPDVIILRFSGTPRDGHGQHQASAILGKEAFFAAADPEKFPEQLRYVKPWKAKRLLWNVFSFTPEQQKEAQKLPHTVRVDPGDYDPVLGYSYGEIAGMSRSQHRSQGMGAPERQGSQINMFSLVAGDPPRQDVFDGIDTTWGRVSDGEPIGRLLTEADKTLDIQHPEKTVPLLLRARALMADLHGPIVERKSAEIMDAIALLSGLSLDATADKFAVSPGGELKITATALNRQGIPAELGPVNIEGTSVSSHAAYAKLVANVPSSAPLKLSIPASAPDSQPYWLREPKQGAAYTVPNQLDIGLPENPPLYRAKFQLRVEGSDLAVMRPVVFRYIDHVRGALVRPVVIEPPLAIEVSEPAVIFPTTAARQIEVTLRANTGTPSGVVRLRVPAGWKVEPASSPFELGPDVRQSLARFTVNPPAGDSVGEVEATADVKGQTISVDTQVIAYPHIPPQTWFPPAVGRLVRADIKLLAKNIGYVVGAGDEIPTALEQLGASVTFLSTDALERGDLSRFDAIVTGVRAYNTRSDLRANESRMLEYVRNGGTLVVQYNVLEGGPGGGGDNSLLKHIGPYPIAISRDRITVEDSPITFPHPDSPLLHRPNQITEGDFSGWVQERGLYFANAWSPRYSTLLATHDPGEHQMLGGTLYTRYGKGAYVFTAFSWFRELPAGVPGAFRIFANLLSAGKTL